MMLFDVSTLYFKSVHADELRPDALNHQPLADMLCHPIEALTCPGDMQVQADLAAADTLAPAHRVQLYRIARQALTRSPSLTNTR